MIILGIDPGIAIVGYGIIEYKDNKFTRFWQEIMVNYTLNGGKSYVKSRMSSHLFQRLRKHGQRGH